MVNMINKHSMAVDPITNVPVVCNLYPVFTSIPDICVMTQKKLSLAWETINEPDPIAITTIALSISLVNPNTGIKETIIDAVVIKATVEEPWADFNAAARIKGSQIPIGKSDNDSPMIVARSEFCKTFPKMPPAPVIKMMVAESVKAFPTQPSVDNMDFSSFFGSNRHKKKPMINAITGSPINEKIFFKTNCHPLSVKKTDRDLSTINIIGITIGKEDLISDGVLIVSAT